MHIVYKILGVLLQLFLFATIFQCNSEQIDSLPISTPAPPLMAQLNTESEWIQASLERHNYLRSLHSSQPLTHNHTLSEISQAWANHLLITTLKNIENNGGGVEGNVYFEHNKATLRKYGLGENLYYTTHMPDHKVNASIGVTLWYNEIKDYDFTFARVKSTSRPDSLIGHFTQLVWNSTRQMGTAYATGRHPRGYLITFVVTNYFPTGNILIRSDFPEKLYLQNVFPPVAQAENEIEDVQKIIKDKIHFWDIRTGEITTPRDWILSAIDKHNAYRIHHDFPPLLENKDLTSVAQSFANELVNKSIKSFNERWTVEGRFGFRNFGATEKAQFGESIIYFINDGQEIKPDYVVSLWYKQHQFYDFENKTTDLNKSHTARTNNFEQLIWKGTTHIGMAYASEKAENGQFITFIVANYYPKGPPFGANIEERNENIPENSCDLVAANTFALICTLFSYIL